ncbi:acetyl-CoA hydrolase/transferase family protein [Alkalihalobacterium elongatum]|uniref:acetyl-CoA hydrolase/transferase family protein n=1 Tax=Alkalihalobacterium elongatum TaxID=2675466 RepID=UPI001C1FD211|nr:acetyl-CoA hydrolase/transferase C-terminal domain-containing protein [Alkalihalobacterium elongatum]
MLMLSTYQEKVMSANDAVRLIEPGDEIITPIAVGEPPALMEALIEFEGLDNNTLYQMLSFREVVPVAKDKLKIVSMFLNSYERAAYANQMIDLLPNHFSILPRMLQTRVKNPIIMAQVSPIDDEGYFSLGTNCDYTATLVNHSKAIFVEVNENMPRTYGKNQIHISQVKAIIEHTSPLAVTGKPIISEKDKAIGQNVANLIKDGDTIQIGFGSIPNAVMEHLINFRNLGVFTEMFPDGLVDLYISGAITNQNKPFYKGISTATFAFGSDRLYQFMHENPALCMIPVNESNSIKRISEFDQFVTINGTVEVDFLGQCNSEIVKGRYYSSSGGQSDFGKGVTLCRDGRGIICLHSTTKDEQISKIVPFLSEKSVVTTSKNDVDIIVTEYGVAHLKNKTISERTRALIDISHPKFREELTFTAKSMGYL